MGTRYVRTNISKGADQKFLRSFFQKATSPRPQAPVVSHPKANGDALMFGIGAADLDVVVEDEDTVAD